MRLQRFEALVEKRVQQRLGEWTPPPLSPQVRGSDCDVLGLVDQAATRSIKTPTSSLHPRFVSRRTAWRYRLSATPS